ncbi:MAG: uroporphyrinogen-III synthase [Planctomycetaceae bacterium]
MLQEKPKLCTFESRRADEMRSLIQRFGGSAVVAPSMKEVPMEHNQEAAAAIERIIAGDVSHLILLTGVGLEAMLQLAESRRQHQPLLQAMQAIPLVVRGPKPAAVLQRLGMKYAVKAAEPNTWRELLIAMDDAKLDISGTIVAVQEYGIANSELYSGLEQRGAHVLPVPVYRWALPDDIEPLQDAIRKTILGELDALLFTSAQQVRHVLMVADQMQQREEWLMAATRTLVASIGPTCTEAIHDESLFVTYEACPPKMAPLVRGVIALLLASR